MMPNPADCSLNQGKKTAMNLKLNKAEKALMGKSLEQLRLMLEYLGVAFDKKSEDKFKLVFLVLKHRELNMIAKQNPEAKSELMIKIKKEEARLMVRSVEELRQLLEYLEVEGVEAIEDKEQLCRLIINQKNLPAVSALVAPKLQAWKQRSMEEAVPSSPRYGKPKPNNVRFQENYETIESEKVSPAADGSGQEGSGREGSAADEEGSGRPSMLQQRPSQYNAEL